jgi:signal transduction histidine kinase/CheY-like chemotaxis protein
MLSVDMDSTESIQLDQLFTKELTDSGSFDIRYEIWSSSFGKVIQALPIPAMLINERHVIWVANEACKRISQNYEKIEGMPFADFFPDAKAREKVLEVFQEVFSKRRTRVVEGILQWESSKVWARMTLRSVRLMRDRFILLLLEDLTREKKLLNQSNRLSQQLERRVMERTSELSQEKARALERERFLSDVFASIQDGVSILDSDLTIVRVNPTMERWYSYMMPLVGKKCYHVSQGRDRPCETCPAQETIETGRPGLQVSPKLGAKGEIVGWLDLYTFPVVDSTTGQIKGVIEYRRDITDRMTLEEQLRQAVKMEAVGRLAGGVAHDFNNLLTAIMGYATLLANKIEEHDPRSEKVRQIQNATERAAELTRQLLAFSRRQVLEMTIINLNALLHDLQGMLKRLIGEHIEVRAILDPSLGNVKADPAQISQLVLNLAVNARDAMPAGGRLTIETSNVTLDDAYARAVSDVRPGDYVLLAVSDTGQGMDADTVSRCFEPFYTTKQKSSGTGLGLSTVYGVVKQHDGHITVYSEEGKGTTFRIYLPRAAGELVKEATLTKPCHEPGGRETILLVEDEDTVRNVALEALESQGYTVLQAASAEEAIMIAGNYPGSIDLLLTDVILPKMDGRSLYGALVGTRPEMKVLYMSGYTDDFIVHHGVLDPDISFLSKPFTLDSLFRKTKVSLART